MYTTKVSNRQLFYMVAQYLWISTLISVPGGVAEISRQDMWLSLFVPSVLAASILFMLIYLSRQFRGRTIYECSEILLGKWGGKLVTLLLTAFFFVIFVRDLRMLVDFINVVLLPRTPELALIVLTVVIIGQIVRGEIEVIARINAVYFWFLTLVVILLPFLLLNRIDLQHLEPVLAHGVGTVLKGSYLLMGWFGEVVCFGVLLGFCSDPRKVPAAAHGGILYATIGLLILFVLNITVLGIPLFASSLYPNYALVREIYVTDFLDRLDLVIVLFWIPSMFVKLAISYYCAVLGLRHLFGVQDPVYFVNITGAFAGVIALFFYETTAQSIHFERYIWTPFSMPFEFGIPVLLTVVALARKFRKGRPGLLLPRASKR